MRTRIGLVVGALFLVGIVGLGDQAPAPRMFKILLNPSGTMVSLDQPVLMNGKYVFHAWPDGEQTALRQPVVLQIVPLTGPTQKTVYQVELNPSGSLLARDVPELRGTTYVFHAWKGAGLLSLRQGDVKKITPLTGDEAFWAIQRAEGEKAIGGTLSLQGTTNVVAIGTAPGANSAQAGPSSLSSINGAPVGNWSYQGTPGVSDAWSPANATMQSGVPTMTAATNGTNPPTMPR